jgi:hypothetical protein
MRFDGLISGLLLLAAYAAGPGGSAAVGAEPVRDSSPDLKAVKEAVARSLPLLVKASSAEYSKHRDCFSCHNQGVPALALSLAQGRGFAVDPDALPAIAEHTAADLESAISAYRNGTGQPGGVMRAGYALWTLEMAAWKPDATTDAVVHYLGKVQHDRGQWTSRSQRPPSESSDFAATYLALRGLRTFGPVRDRADAGEAGRAVSTRRARALAWFKEAKPKETEDRVFRLWGMKYAGASADELQAAAQDLQRTVSADGGWRQLPGPGEGAGHSSDAYATGSALAALHLAGGMSTADPAYVQGLAYLIKSQRPDGSWLVKSRSKPFQPYFESGFPHGKDQFISAAGSAWAVAALVLACPPSPPSAHTPSTAVD